MYLCERLRFDVTRLKRERGENLRLSRSCKFLYNVNTTYHCENGKVIECGTKSEYLPYDLDQPSRCKGLWPICFNTIWQKLYYRIVTLYGNMLIASAFTDSQII